MKIAELHKLFLECPKICTDTRKAEDNSLFFALKGENFDANDFANEALKKGCKYAIVDKKAVATDERYILVENVLTTLQELANFHRNYCSAKIIGITGTNGKTTTKELTSTILAKKYKTISTQGNLNNHIGVPLTLLSLKEDTEIGVIEMGANHLNEIAELCAISEPDFGIITNVGTGHIEGFGSFEGVFKTKTELYQAVVKRNGLLFVNTDNELLSNKATELHDRIYSYGTAQSQAIGLFENASPFLTLSLDDTPLQTQLIGAYNFENVLTAYSIGKYFDVPKAEILEAIANYIPKNNRSQLVETERNILILDAYNANPTSMKEAIISFSETDFTDKKLILGDMLELGHLSESSHLEIKELLVKLNLDAQTFLVGQHFSKEKSGNFIYFENTEKIATFLQENTLQDKHILIKGSRGIRLENLVKVL